MVAMRGTRPSPALLGRIRRGEIGGVILFGANITGPAQLRALTADAPARRSRRRAAAAPDLDRPGGRARAAPAAGPARRRPRPSSARRARRASGGRRCSPAARCGRAASTSISRRSRTCRVPGRSWPAEDRTFGASTAVVARAVTAFAHGLADARVAAAAKHFPGIGRATRTPTRRSSRSARAARRSRRDLGPFRAAIAAGAPIVMISNASYPALDSKPAPWSPRIQSAAARRARIPGRDDHGCARRGRRDAAGGRCSRSRCSPRRRASTSCC